MIELSHRIFIEHSQYYTGCAWPTVLGVGETPFYALQDAIEMLCQSDLKEDVLAQVREYPNDEPDGAGALGEIPGAFDDGSEVSWHCELTIGDKT